MIAEYEDQRRFLSRLVELGYKKGKMNKIIIPFLLEQMKPHSLKLFSDIAIQCLNDDRKQRPMMEIIVKELETALEYQTETNIRPQTVISYGTLYGRMETSQWSFQLKSNQKLRKITIYHDSWINSLIFTTENSYGSLQSSQQFGGLDNPHKGRMDEIIFDDAEEVMIIRGTQYDSVISSLEFFTNFRSHGIFGRFRVGLQRATLPSHQLWRIYHHSGYEGDEKLLVYKLEDNGSLDKYLTSTNLSWEQRLRICLGAARGLEYLHCGDGGHRIIHRDIKSSNILLDANWEAKISDFGLSKFGPTNQQFTFLVTTAAGTFGYVDPLYVKTGVLTKESDVYSFGVVLFEVLCGRPAMIAEYEDERRFLSRLVELGYKSGELNKIIIPCLIEQMKPRSLKVLSEIAFQCLNNDRKLRPTMGSVVKQLESALKYQLVTLAADEELIGISTTVGKNNAPSILLLQLSHCIIVHTIRDEIRTQNDEATRTHLWGSLKGGSPWLFQLERNQKLRKITVYYERYIQSLVFTAENSYGVLQSSQQYGGLGDPKKGKIYEVTLAADEELIGISTTVGKNNGIKSICSLCFLTNKKKYEPLGEHASNYYHYTKTWDVGLFAGFYGRSGSLSSVYGIYIPQSAPSILLLQLSHCIIVHTIRDEIRTQNDEALLSEILINSFDAGNPLYLQNNDYSDMPIVGFKLTGFENYKTWSTAMKIALKDKNKMGFINGTCVKPITSVVLAQQWERCNVIVFC
uniref:Putative jacalin-like lectin domain-containing protein n=1 Tax=Tanacetum cinerariifolium TaxID=118510 RepID=A0A6L2NXG5_TANCI|nr:putative jacalin-like lectin domain-containing protein [Tanacetum cinerariifolium]